MADNVTTRKVEDFASLYANNTRFESSVWDLKILFGELNQSEGADKPVIELHTAMTIAWPTAKIMAYFLVMNCVFQQANTGPIRIPPHALPARPNPSDAIWAGTDTNLVNYLAWVHDQFFGAAPYVPPTVEQTGTPSAAEKP